MLVQHFNVTMQFIVEAYGVLLLVSQEHVRQAGRGRAGLRVSLVAFMRGVQFLDQRPPGLPRGKRGNQVWLVPVAHADIEVQVFEKVC